MRYPHSWMVDFMENPHLKWVTWGSPFSGNPHVISWGGRFLSGNPIKVWESTMVYR